MISVRPTKRTAADARSSARGGPAVQAGIPGQKQQSKGIASPADFFPPLTRDRSGENPARTRDGVY